MLKMSMKPSTKIVKFMAPGSGVLARGWGQYDHIVKLYQILENRLLFSHIYLLKTKCLVIKSMNPSTKIVKFITPLSGVQALGWGQDGHIVKNFISYKILFFTAHVSQTKINSLIHIFI